MKISNSPNSSEESKDLKRQRIINATLIGFLIGIVAWSIFKDTWGLVTLIPLYFIYRLTKKDNSKSK